RLDAAHEPVLALGFAEGSAHRRCARRGDAPAHRGPPRAVVHRSHPGLGAAARARPPLPPRRTHRRAPPLRGNRRLQAVAAAARARRALRGRASPLGARPAGAGRLRRCSLSEPAHTDCKLRSKHEPNHLAPRFFSTDLRPHAEHLSTMTTKIEIHTRTSEQRSWRAWAIVSGVALATLSACATPSGELGGVDEEEGAGESDGGSTGPGLGASEGGEAGESGESGEPEPMACDDVGCSPPRSLTERQYANTVRDLFGITELHWIGPGPSPWPHQESYGTFDAMTPTPEVVAGYEILAAQVAQ